MADVDGFVLAVPNVNRQQLIDDARQFDPVFGSSTSCSTSRPDMPRRAA